MVEDDEEQSDEYGPRRHGLKAADLESDTDLDLDEDDELDAGIIEDESDADDEDVSERFSERAGGEEDEEAASTARLKKSRGGRANTGAEPPSKVRARKRPAAPENKPFSDYETGAEDEDFASEAAGEGEVTSKVGRNAGPLEGELSEREVLRRDAKARTHRQPTGMPAPTKRVVRRRVSGMAARRAQRAPAAKNKRRSKG